MFADTNTLEKIQKALPEHPLRKILFLVTFFCGFIGLLFSLYTIITQSNYSEISFACPVIAAQEEGSFGSIAVYISGAVLEPGMRTLPSSSRIADLIAISGGFSETADPVFIHKNLNLAQKLVDAQQVYVPFIEEGELAALKKKLLCTVAQTTADGSLVKSDVENQSELISINTATESQLQTLKGIGAARAASIVAQRPYISLDELVSKKVISESVFAEIRQQLIL